MISRRGFLAGGSGLLAGTLLPRSAAADAPPVTVSLNVNAVARAVVMPLDFAGLSYESAQLANPEFFAADNAALVEKVRSLAQQGVLRLGGSLSDFTLWSGPDAPPPSQAEQEVVDNRARAYREWQLVDAVVAARRRAVITPEAIHQLRAFLDATGWSLLYGLNFGSGTPQQAAAEAAYVQQALGPRLLAFQFGNEADFYGGGHRPKPWEFEQYWADYQRFAAAVKQRAPQARFAGPDVAVRMDWVRDYAEKAKGEAVLLTGHYYAMGPPEDPQMNAERLLHEDPKLAGLLLQAAEAAAIAGVPYRMSEGNSCYHSGKPGVSDRFAAALWGADFMLRLAQAGSAGVNFHGGGDSAYAPIAGDREQGFSERPLYYGMQFIRPLAGCRFLDCALQSNGVNLTAYAAEGADGRWLVLINKDRRAVRVGLAGASFDDKALQGVWRLAAPSLDSSHASLRFAEATDQERLAAASGGLNVSAYSAVLARFN